MDVKTQSKIGRLRHGFTLIELLVVISIISLLISLLLPALAGARRTGMRVACMATLKNIGQGASAYSTDNDDAILGAPSTSGIVLYPPTKVLSDDEASVVQRWDFMGPLAKMWGLSYARAPAPVPALKTIARFNGLRGDPSFMCRANNFLAWHYDGPQAGTGRMISYNTVRYQLYIKASSGAEAGLPLDPYGLSWHPGDPEAMMPANWKPSVTRLGVPANKVFCADGSRFNTRQIPPYTPDYDLVPQAPYGGAFSDTGAFTTFSRSHDRGMAPGNASSVPPGILDPRAYAFRHSTGDPPNGAAANAFKLNLGFHDGHAETQGDLQASNPHQWLPQGSTVAQVNLLWNDTQAAFGFTSAFTIGP